MGASPRKGLAWSLLSRVRELPGLQCFALFARIGSRGLHRYEHRLWAGPCLGA